MLSIKKILTKILQALYVSEAEGTTEGAYAAPDRYSCRLVKQGRQVRCYLTIGNVDGETTLPYNSFLFQIPSGYRPSTVTYGYGLAYRATGTVVPVTFRVSTGGVLSQTTTSNATALMMSMEWTTS